MSIEGMDGNRLPIDDMKNQLDRTLKNMKNRYDHLDLDYKVHYLSFKSHWL